MDGWLKGLVAAACVVVIAQGAYFGWQEVERQMTLHKLHKAQQDAKKWADEKIAEMQTRQKDAEQCKGTMDRLYTYETFGLPEGKKPDPVMISELKKCAANNMLSAAHLAEATPYL